MQHYCHIRVTMVAAGGLASLWRQGICNHHVDVAVPRISGIPRRNVKKHLYDLVAESDLLMT